LRADCSPLSTDILYCTESDDTRGCKNTICPPEDEQGTKKHVEDYNVTYEGWKFNSGNYLFTTDTK